MTERVRVELERLAVEYKGQEHDWSAWERIINRESQICFGTFLKYVKLEEVEHKEEKTLEEIVEKLNDCAGEDCYGASWEYRVIDGKPYEVWSSYIWN